MIWIFLACLATVYGVYFVAAMLYEFGSEESVRLLWMTLFAVFVLVVRAVMVCFGGKKGNDCVKRYMEGLKVFFGRHGNVISW